ncbi:MAG: right-handed parallel beta-helix repeat-containing protein [Bacteroidia bacterium]|nr:right-handed parallel beta-helix repeat-containing protein [Bacteroidia bacterium]
MKSCWLPIVALFLLSLSASCDRPVNPGEEGLLTFSRDTVMFDTVFTTFLTPSERLIVFNETGRTLSIDRVWLEDGADSEFNMIVDGIQANDVQDLTILSGDSLHLFVNLKSKEKDELARDVIAFEINGEVQRVPVEAFILDAYFLTARLAQEGDFLTVSGFFFRQDTTLTPDKPIIMDGPIFIPEGITVTILPGTEIYFTPYQFGIRDSNSAPVFALYSWLIVDGTLKAEGTGDFPIVFQGTRRDSLYLENPAQWRGLWFREGSINSKLKHCEIKNGLLGVQVDGPSTNLSPKLLMQYCEVKNMGAHGIIGTGFDRTGTALNSPPSIIMENCIVNTCKQRTLAILGGGHYRFYNCTFANFSLFRFSRRTPQLLLTNWWYNEDGESIDVYPTDIELVNSIVWGSEDDEVVLDSVLAYDNLRFDHCLIKSSEEYQPFVLPHLFDGFMNVDPLFNDYFTRDYRPMAGSPVINTGVDFPLGSSFYLDDFRNRIDSLRYDGFDIGAWEYYPIE